ncbi:serine/threonine-protein kinase [Bacteroidota bacterium]
MKSLIGQTIDNYKIVDIVGKGGMGIVYKAEDINLEKSVALKVMDPVFASDEAFIKRFKSEAKALAKVESPHIVNIYTLRITEFGTFIVMELVEGTNLDKVIKERGAIPWQESLSIFKQLLLALKHAHYANVIHRDIKPSNVLITKESLIKLTDFGLAKVKQRDAESTVTQMHAGTLHYMSPEQIKTPTKVDFRSDIYSLGITFYEMLLGRVPFKGKGDEFSIIKAIVEQKVTDLSKINPSIPKQLSKVILKSLEKNPAKRYQSADEMLNEMEDFESKILHREKGSRKKSGGTTPGKPGIKKRKILYYTIGIVLLGALSIFIVNNFLDTPSEVEQSEDPVIRNEIKDDSIRVKNEIIYGSMNVRSNPSEARIYLNGDYIGQTPMEIDSLIDGIYTLRLRKSGYEDFTNNEVKIYRGESNNLDVSLSRVKEVVKANLTLRASPGGSVYIDNRLAGETFNESITERLNPGSHNIKFVHPEFGTKTTSVSLQEGESKNLVCYFQHTVNIQSLDENEESVFASILINNSNTEMYTPREIKLGAGTYEIHVRREGYETIEGVKTVEIKPDFSENLFPIVFHMKKL